MRILILSNIDPYCIGGAEVQARLLAQSFAARGCQVTIAGYAIPDGQIQVAGRHELLIKTVHLRTVRSNRFTRALSFFYSLSLFLLRHRSRFDIIYCRMIGESALVAALLKSAHLIKVPIIACSESQGEMGDVAFLRSLPCTALLVRLLNRQCAAINVLSPDIEAELQDFGLDSQRFVYIPNGIILPDNHAATPFLKSGRLLFLFVGRLVPVKGVDVLLQASRLVIDQGFDIGINIVGQGPLASYLMNLSRALAIDERVRFHGCIEHAALGQYYRSNHVLVLPSKNEGQGVVVIEAMGFGLSAVVTRSGGPEYLVDDSVGRVCPASDPEALAQAMAEMCRLPQTRLMEMSREAYRRVAEKYDITRIADTYLTLFQQLTNIDPYFDSSAKK